MVKLLLLFSLAHAGRIAPNPLFYCLDELGYFSLEFEHSDWRASKADDGILSYLSLRFNTDNRNASIFLEQVADYLIKNNLMDSSQKKSMIAHWEKKGIRNTFFSEIKVTDKDASDSPRNISYSLLMQQFLSAVYFQIHKTSNNSKRISWESGEVLFGELPPKLNKADWQKSISKDGIISYLNSRFGKHSKDAESFVVEVAKVLVSKNALKAGKEEQEWIEHWKNKGIKEDFLTTLKKPKRTLSDEPEYPGDSNTLQQFLDDCHTKLTGKHSDSKMLDWSSGEKLFGGLAKILTHKEWKEMITSNGVVEYLVVRFGVHSVTAEKFVENVATELVKRGKLPLEKKAAWVNKWVDKGMTKSFLSQLKSIKKGVAPESQVDSKYVETFQLFLNEIGSLMNPEHKAKKFITNADGVSLFGENLISE